MREIELEQYMSNTLTPEAALMMKQGDFYAAEELMSSYSNNQAVETVKRLIENTDLRTGNNAMPKHRPAFNPKKVRKVK